MTWRVQDRFKPKSTPGPATGSNATFRCGGCGLFKLAAGRRKVGRVWHCKACQAAAVPV